MMSEGVKTDVTSVSNARSTDTVVTLLVSGYQIIVCTESLWFGIRDRWQPHFFNTSKVQTDKIMTNKTESMLFQFIQPA